jgi:hypothetical protein
MGQRAGQEGIVPGKGRTVVVVTNEPAVAAWVPGRRERTMDCSAVIASAIRHWPHARGFQRIFPNAEHTIIEALRDFDPDGWKPVSEWISRASLHNRYAVWLVVAIEITVDGAVSELEKPELYVIEVEKVEMSKDDENVPLWECGYLQCDEGDWERLVENDGDFASVELDMVTDAPVDGFTLFWNGTRPRPRPVPPGGVCLRAPLRFMT